MAKILIGVGGGIAAYKLATVTSRLVQAEHEVHVLLTYGATRFVGEATFAALCNRRPVVDTYDPRFPLGAHIELAEGADLLVVAPATARILASCALGTADDLLATTYLTVSCPVLFAPAMSNTMWEKPSVQRNCATLREDNVSFVGPETGWLSCRRQGAGRMSEPEALVQEVIGKLAEVSTPATGDK